MADVGEGFVVCDATRKKFRAWGIAGPEWTSSLNDALWFARRSDAERFCADDEDAWYISPTATLRLELVK